MAVDNGVADQIAPDEPDTAAVIWDSDGASDASRIAKHAIQAVKLLVRRYIPMTRFEPEPSRLAKIFWQLKMGFDREQNVEISELGRPLAGIIRLP